MAKKGKRTSACVEVIVRAIAQGLRDGAGFFADADFVGDGAVSPDFAGAPAPDLDEMDRARARLAKGVEIDQIYRLLCHTGINPDETLLDALRSGDFTAEPRIKGRVFRVMPRHAAEGYIKGVKIITDDEVISGDRPVLLILPPGASLHLENGGLAPRTPTLLRQMIITLLLKEFPDGLSTDAIPSKMRILTGDRWEKACKAPLGDPARRVTYPEPGRMTIIRAIKDYLARPEAYQKRR